MLFRQIPSVSDTANRAGIWLNNSSWRVRAVVASISTGFGFGIASWGGPGSPVCPVHAVTGLWCPGCGLTRASLCLIRGDVPAALRFNVLSPLFLAVMVWGGVAWVSGSHLPRPTVLPGAVWKALAVVLIVFAVARNLPGLEQLRPL